jgi:hypothetical protein
MSARSRTGRQLVKAADAAGWTVNVTPGHGATEQTYFGPPRGDGTRPRLTRDVPCESEGIRLRAPDGRRAVAMFVTLDGKSWTGTKPVNAWAWTPPGLPTPTSTDDLLALLHAESTRAEHTPERNAA